MGCELTLLYSLYHYISRLSRVVKVLEVLRPFISLLPEVAKPERKVCFVQISVSVGNCLS